MKDAADNIPLEEERFSKVQDDRVSLRCNFWTIMFSAMKGIIGASLPETKSLELKGLIEDIGSDDLEADKEDVSF